MGIYTFLYLLGKAAAGAFCHPEDLSYGQLVTTQPSAVNPMLFPSQYIRYILHGLY